MIPRFFQTIIRPMGSIKKYKIESFFGHLRVRNSTLPVVSTGHIENDDTVL